DISPGNILIACDNELDHNDPHESKIQGGLLIDWDLSKVIDRDDEHSGSTARQQTRTVSYYMTQYSRLLTYLSAREPGSLWLLSLSNAPRSATHSVMTLNHFSGFLCGLL
ncbi:hypothetical protein F5888DRAFT_1606886, partial [Russula emetica]